MATLKTSLEANYDGHRTDRSTKRLIGARATALPKKLGDRGRSQWYFKPNYYLHLHPAAELKKVYCSEIVCKNSCSDVSLSEQLFRRLNSSLHMKQSEQLLSYVAICTAGQTASRLNSTEIVILCDCVTA